MKEIIKILVELLDEPTLVWGLLEAVQQEDGTLSFANSLCRQKNMAIRTW